MRYGAVPGTLRTRRRRLESQSSQGGLAPNTHEEAERSLRIYIYHSTRYPGCETRVDTLTLAHEPVDWRTRQC